MSTLVARSGNEALTLNPPIGLDIHITTHGSDWYWAVFSVFGVAALSAFAISRFLKAPNQRFFYYNYIATSFFLAIAYYTMASDLGWTGIQAEFNHDTVTPSLRTPGIRQIFYTRYVGWFLALPPLLANVAVLSSVPISSAIFTGLTAEVFVVTLLIGSLIHSTYKWGYWVFAVVALFITGYELIFTFRRSAQKNVTHIDRAVTTVTVTAATATFLLFLYPVSWGLSEGGNVIQPDSEAVFYGVLDICLYVILPTYFLVASNDVDLESLGVSTFSKPIFHSEKDTRYSGDTAVSNFSNPATEPPVAANVEPANPATTV